MRSVENFDEYLSRYDRGVEECEEIKISEVEGRLAFEKMSKDSNTCNNYLAWIKCFFQFCKNQGYNVLNTDGLVCMRGYDKKIESISEDEAVRLLDFFKKKSAKTERQRLIKDRNLCIVWILLYAGLRVTECITLRKEDILKDGIQIIGKWGKRRVVYLNDEIRAWIDRYLGERTDGSPFLFVNHSNNVSSSKLSRNSVEKTIKRAWKELWIEGKIFPHRLRHTFATMLLSKNAEIFYIQKLLGHKNFSTTEEYLTVLNETAKKTQSLLDGLFKK